MTPREVLGRLLAWSRRGELDREMAAELEAHVDLLARDLEHQGMPAAEARIAARRQVGNLTAHREQSRDAWGFPRFDAVLQDIRYAIRGLRRSPAFTAAVIATLALGIGVNVAMFAVIDRLMFRPLPYMKAPGQTHLVYLQTILRGIIGTNTVFPYLRYLNLKEGAQGVGEFAAHSEWRFAVGSGDASRIRKVAGVSASYWSLFEAPPSAGRYFVASEDDMAATPVAVISHGLWLTDYGRRDVVGKTLKIGVVDYTIIGVSPPGFVGAAAGMSPDVFVPITTIPLNHSVSSQQTYKADYSWDWVQVLVRRAPGVSQDAASRLLSEAYIKSRALARAINPRVMADSLVHPRAIAGPVRQAAGPDAGLESRVLLWGTGVAAMVLLIACANVTSLMLARVIRRRREITVRLALGVGRARLAAQFVTEGLLLAAIGGVAGVILAQWGGVAIRSLLLPEGSPFNLAEDWRTLAVAIVTATGAALITAIGPAIVATRSDLAATLKASAREGTHQRSTARLMLLVGQGAMSALLLVGAALFVRSLGNAEAVPLGYDARPVLEVVTDYRGYEMDSVSGPAMRRRLLAAAQAIPGVRYAASFNSRLFGTNTAELAVDGIDSVSALGRFNFQISTPDFFRVMDMHLVRGRSFTDTDGLGAPRVAVVSEAMGSALWPGRDPIGQCIRVGLGNRVDARQQPCTTVIGVAVNTAQQVIGDDPRFMYYLPEAQVMPGGLRQMLLRMDGDGRNEMERVRRALNAAMPGDGFVVVRPLQERVDDQSRSWRLGATLFLAFGALALLVTVVGLYGMINYNVTQRAHELGVRIALGAQPWNLMRLVVGQGVSLMVASVATGLFAAWIAARWVQPLLFKQDARDPVIYAAIAVIMIAVAAIAAAAPAMRAARADPNAALRAD
jgi:putative ABC transport system permease protein